MNNNRKIAEIIYNSCCDMDYMDYVDTMEIEIQKIENALDILENYLRGRIYESI